MLRRHSAGWVCAYDGDDLVGSVNVAWDGAIHFFLLDTAVAPAYQHPGIGLGLVERAGTLSRERGGDRLHVDHDPELIPSYWACGSPRRRPGSST